MVVPMSVYSSGLMSVVPMSVYSSGLMSVVPMSVCCSGLGSGLMSVVPMSVCCSGLGSGLMSVVPMSVCCSGLASGPDAVLVVMIRAVRGIEGSSTTAWWYEDLIDGHYIIIHNTSLHPPLADMLSSVMLCNLHRVPQESYVAVTTRAAGMGSLGWEVIDGIAQIRTDLDAMKGRLTTAESRIGDTEDITAQLSATITELETKVQSLAEKKEDLEDRC
ncbi:hypothetical protein NHX12_012890 [Muraenolepis orangiensis]|uniref:Uncharacterized protein n=1 Tax=Muraenolepis orangiensis TaxID=630683 RepID=A0A9Q0DDW5_9TELE|nr:hypothetical protein NHX12_012890 [Muraenolepis orangiensis]